MTPGSICQSSPKGRRNGLWCWIIAHRSLFWFHHRCACVVLLLSEFLQISFFINLGNCYFNAVDTAFSNHSKDYIRYYIELASCNSNHWLFSPRIKSPGGTYQTSPSSHITHDVHPGPWAKGIPWMGLPLPDRTNPACPPQHIFMCPEGLLSLSLVSNNLDWAWPAQLADPLVLTEQVAFLKCVPQCLNVPTHIALSVTFNSPLYHSILVEAGAC